MITRSIAGITGQRFGLRLSRSLLATLQLHGVGGPSVGLQKAEFRFYSSVGVMLESSPVLGIREADTHSMSHENSNRQDATGSQHLEFPQELSDPVRRRAWLLAKALETQPLDRALDLARAAEMFITDAGDNGPGSNVAAPHAIAARPPSGSVAATPGEQRIKPAGVVLAPEARDRLLDRIANGARNAELAGEFGLTPKQVQGIRMGSAREINRRRTQISTLGV
jgi:hypothetical protein